MRKAGKILLFFSSYLILFLILLVREIQNLENRFSLSWEYFSGNLLSFVLIVSYLVFIAISFLSLFVFKGNYRSSTGGTHKKVKIISVSNASSEVISYLLTMVIPLIGLGSVSKRLSGGGWADILIMAIVMLTVLVLYINSSLVVINPALMMMGYSIYKIQVENSILREGVLIARSGDIPVNFGPVLTLHEIDEDVYIYRRVNNVKRKN